MRGTRCCIQPCKRFPVLNNSINHTNIKFSYAPLLVSNLGHSQWKRYRVNHQTHIMPHMPHFVTISKTHLSISRAYRSISVKGVHYQCGLKGNWLPIGYRSCFKRPICMCAIMDLVCIDMGHLQTRGTEIWLAACFSLSSNNMLF